MRAVPSLPDTPATRAAWNVATFLGQVPDANFKKTGVHFFKSDMNPRFWGKTWNYKVFLKLALTICTRQHSAVRISLQLAHATLPTVLHCFPKISLKTKVHYRITCPVQLTSMNFAKRTVICLNLWSAVWLTACPSMLLMAKLAQFLQQLFHSTRLSCSVAAVCSSESRRAGRLSKRIRIPASSRVSTAICTPRELPRCALVMYHAHCQLNSHLHYNERCSAG